MKIEFTGSKIAKGRPVQNIINIEQGEKIHALKHKVT
jgi:hypothetical protein